MMVHRAARRVARQVVVAAAAGALGASSATLSADSPGSNACPPSAATVGFSDALDRTSVGGVKIGGLSDLAYDPRTEEYVSVQDRSSDGSARLVFFRFPAAPQATRTLTLHQPDGAPYGLGTFDGEGVAVLPNGDYLVSSETQPSIVIFDRKGRQRGTLEIPARFRIIPNGQGVINGSLEALAVSPDGKFAYAMTGSSLTGDEPARGEGVLRRFLVYRSMPGGGYALARQVGYRVDHGNRVVAVAAYGEGRLLVMESAYDAVKGNSIRLYAVHGVDTASDVSAVRNLSDAPPGAVVGKMLVADLVRCPTMHATSPRPQINPLMDNYEGLQVDMSQGRRRARLHLVSDDGFSATQITRVLTLTADLP